ncbi:MULTISPECIES: hypothetical protein [Calothrix]|uniref:Uncharacterized protein n=2 Tax=Calothrix TaxID=1186 RepID=A0ABR8AEH9_9CYAN|nr:MULTISPECIES: hypothetical protein [Calothrix]MBD2197441.1 hypothetical protein [Calothrix parietina FACHB-288]MBD2226008.1 hypothetical protein [Calothrix anomala FACHB-343]
MNKPLDAALSVEISQRIKSKAKKTFDNAYKAALATEKAKYVQGFVVFSGQPYRPVEHAWIELDESIVDPNLPHLQKKPENLYYFPAESFSIKKLKAIIEESEEDYPEDDPLPIYGDPPYEYYGDVMLGGKNYLDAYQAAEAKSKEINQPKLDSN